MPKKRIAKPQTAAQRAASVANLAKARAKKRPSGVAVLGRIGRGVRNTPTGSQKRYKTGRLPVGAFARMTEAKDAYSSLKKPKVPAKPAPKRITKDQQAWAAKTYGGKPGDYSYSKSGNLTFSGKWSWGGPGSKFHPGK